MKRYLLRISFVFTFLVIFLSGGALPVFADTTSCTLPRTYSVRSIGAGFQMSSSTLIRHLSSAEAIWEKPVGKDMFVYKEKGGDISIDLLFDNRQITTQKIADTRARLSSIKELFDTLRTTHSTLIASTSVAQDSLQARIIKYEAAELLYNTKVQATNNRGGATAEEFTVLQAEQRALSAEFTQLKADDEMLRARVVSLNTTGTLLNKLAEVLNVFVERYNTTVTSVGEFEEGFYKKENGIESIGIYSFGTDEQLIRVLAHEFGHALGLGHVSDKESLMYKSNTVDTLQLTVADRALLKESCGY